MFLRRGAHPYYIIICITLNSWGDIIQKDSHRLISYVMLNGILSASPWKYYQGCLGSITKGVLEVLLKVLW